MNTPVKQKEPSIWMAVAIIQTLIWFYLLPELMKPLWKTFEGKSPLESELLLMISTVPTSFILYTLCMLPIYYLNLPFFEQYKISNRTWPWRSDDPNVRNEFWRLTIRSIKLNGFNMLLLLPCLVYLKHLHPYSLSSFDVEDWPTYTVMARDIAKLTLLHEFSFYATHRAMHAYPFLYKYHKVHHEYKMNTVLASQYNHPVDYILSIAGPALVAGMIVKPHSITLFEFTLYTLYANYDDHIGYSFPWSPVRWIPFASLTEQHEFHHSVNLGCFASKLNIYDKIFHSENVYLKWVMRRNLVEKRD